jgi:two-component system response regulator VicR
MTLRLLLVEDDPSIGDMVDHYLTNEGYAVTVVRDGVAALETFRAASFDLVLLDLMLPKMNGLDVLQRFRESSNVPILILSAKDGEVDKALGLRFGADDYIAKPFSLLELSARVSASIRRATQYSETIADQAEESGGKLTVGELVVTPANFTVTKNGEDLKLTAKEFQILKLFVEHPTRVYTKATLYELVWNDMYHGDENVINVHMRRLREKIEDDPSHPRYIKTLWGIGYRLGEQ